VPTPGQLAGRAEGPIPGQDLSRADPRAAGRPGPSTRQHHGRAAAPIGDGQGPIPRLAVSPGLSSALVICAHCHMRGVLRRA
jgi:hypothetical protein